MKIPNCVHLNESKTILLLFYIYSKSKETERQPMIGLPYVKNVSEKLRRIFGKHGIRVYHKPVNTIRSILVHPKDRTDKLKKCGVIYRLKCKVCGESYIGETGRCLCTRITEHKKTGTALREHVLKTKHDIDWDGVEVVSDESNFLQRKIKESINIRKEDPKLNRDQGWELPQLYNHLL